MQLREGAPDLPQSEPAVLQTASELKGDLKQLAACFFQLRRLCLGFFRKSAKKLL